MSKNDRPGSEGPDFEVLDAEMQEIIQAHLDKAGGNVDLAKANLSALMRNHPELRERYLNVALERLLEALLDEVEAEDKQNKGMLN